MEFYLKVFVGVFIYNWVLTPLVTAILKVIVSRSERLTKLVLRFLEWGEDFIENN